MPTLALAITGNMRLEMERQAEQLAMAVTSATKIAGKGLQSELRAQATAQLGVGVGRAWRLKVYPERGASAGAAALVYSKAPNIVRAFTEGATIKSEAGFFLAIPTDAAPRRGTGGKRITPSNFPENRLGPLRFVYRRQGPSLLVADGLRARTGKRGGFGRAGKRARERGNTATVVMFILVPQVRLRKRLDLNGPARAWSARMPRLIAREYLRLDNQRRGRR